MDANDADINDVLLRLPFNTEIVKGKPGKEKDKSCIIARVNIRTANDADSWLKAYASATSTHWVVSRTYPQLEKLVYRKDYVCHRSRVRRAESDGVDNVIKEGKKKTKKCDCPAGIIIKIYMESSRDMFAKKGLYGFIKLIGKHNHSADLSLLPSSEGLRSVFEEYFSCGMGISGAMKFHKHKLQMAEDFTESVLTDASKHPRYRTVAYWHTKWLEYTTVDLGPLTESRVTTLLREKLPTYTEMGCCVIVDDNPFSIVVLTPIMMRAHHMPEARGPCYIDTTNAACGAQNLAVTFMLMPCAAGAVPLAVIITEGQNENNYASGFRQLRECGLALFGGNLHPEVFMTNDCQAAEKSLESVWPESIQLLCLFHVLLANWQWLWDSNNHILVEDRSSLMNDFRRVMMNPTPADAESIYYTVLSGPVAFKYPQWISRLQTYWEQKERWCVAWRSLVHEAGQEMCSFNELTFRLFRDFVLSQAKAFNALALVDYVCTTMEQYCSNRLMDLANLRLVTPMQWLGRLLENSEGLNFGCVTHVHDSVYCLSSETDVSTVYFVDTSISLCSCSEGLMGQFCKHLAVVLQGSVFPDPPPISSSTRHSMAVLSLGPKAESLSYYAQLERVVKKNASKVPSADVGLDNSDKLWDTFIGLLNQNHIRFGNTSSGLRMMVKRLQRINSSSQWESFMHTAGNGSHQNGR